MSKELHKFQVIIPYCEPTYEMRMGSRLKFPYLAQYRVTAETKKAAVKHALELFEQDARESSVGWIRIPYERRIKAELLSEERLPRKAGKIIHLKTKKEKQ